MQNHFELFKLPLRFAIDAAALDAAYREVQTQVHPDKFVRAGAAEQRVAMQWATRANEAYQTLKDPMRRARYLCELQGVSLQTESNTAMPVPFLMEQMAWREQLQEARQEKSLETLEQLEQTLQASRKQWLLQIEQLLDLQDFVQAAAQIRCLMFVQRFGEEVAQAFELLEN
jgi:molecular chaperone HscB